MKIFIVGATGFIGSHLVDHLNSVGISPFCMVRTEPKWIRGKNYTCVKCSDFSGEHISKLLGEAEYIFYLGGVTKASSYEEYVKGNHSAFVEFYEKLKSCGKNCKWLCYISTMAVNAPNPDGSPITEDSPLNPVSHYGKSKALNEEYLAGKKDFPVLVVRLPGVYGPRDLDFLEYFKTVQKGFAPVFGKKPETSLIYAGDIAEALFAAMKKGLSGTYYISDGRTYTYGDIAREARKLLNKKAVYVKIPIILAKIFAHLSERIKVRNIVNEQKVMEISAGSWLCSNAKILSALPEWRPKVFMPEGFRMTVDWYIQNGYLEKGV